MRIRKAYFTLAELADNWAVSLQDLGYLAENDELRLTIRVYEAEVISAGVRHSGGVQAAAVQAPVQRYDGLLVLRPADAHALFRNGDSSINHFIEPGTGAAVRLVEPVFILLGDVVVTTDERDRVERNHPGLSRRDALSQIDFASFNWDGRTFRFSPTQARFLEALLHAAHLGEAWVSGKQVLGTIGSSMVKAGELFKRRPAWRDIVDSDGRGNYRLSPTFLAYPPS